MPDGHVLHAASPFRAPSQRRWSQAALCGFLLRGRPPCLPFSADDDAFFALDRDPSSCDAALRTVFSPAAAIISVSRRTPVSAASNHNGFPGGSISGRRSAAGATFASPDMRPRGIVNDAPLLSWTTNASYAREYRASTIVVSVFAAVRARFPVSRISASVVMIRRSLLTLLTGAASSSARTISRSVT
jgi:hypothetical protein